MPRAVYYDVGMRLLVALETNKEIFFPLSFLYSKKCRGNHFQGLNTGACSWVSMLPRLAASERESNGFSGQLFRRQRGAMLHCSQLWFRDLLGQGGGPNTFPFIPFLKARIEVLTCPGGVFSSLCWHPNKKAFLVLVVVFFVNFSPMFLALRCQLLFLAM